MPELNDDRVTFYARGDGVGINGQPVDDDLIFVTSCWFGYRQQYIRETKSLQDTIFENSTDIYIRDKQAKIITNDMLAVIAGETYEILAVNPDRQHKAYQLITLKEVK